jgi:hypothetical protein
MIFAKVVINFVVQRGAIDFNTLKRFNNFKNELNLKQLGNIERKL